MNETQNVRIFLQSLRTLPEGGKVTSLSEANSFINNSSDEVFSLYELILQLRGSSISAEERPKLDRRILSLIAALGRSQKVYYSKLLILKSFWEDACLNSRTQLMLRWRNYQQLKQQGEQFRIIVLRDEHYFHVLRFANVFIKGCLSSIESREGLHSVKLFLRHLRLPRLWKICQHKVSQIVYSHEHESCWKVKLCLEYCEHLLYFHLISVDQKDLEKNHREFLSAVRQCLRLMKKFYSMSMAKHIPKLKTIILSSVSLCEEHLPFKEFKVLKKLS